MNIPRLPENTSPFLWGAAAGAVALAVVGFNWGGWVTGNSADKLAEQRAEAALVSALAPICVEQFQQSADATASLAALKEVTSWKQGQYVGDGGWATMPGSTDEPNHMVAKACADALTG